MLVEHLPLDEELYKKITRMSYSEHVPLQKLINDMLKEYLNVYALSKKMGYVLISKDVLKQKSLCSYKNMSKNTCTKIKHSS